MSALSQTTSKVRLGQMCTCNSYRNPAYLTKVASNIDVMSNGRLEYAIGAGWYDHEYKAYGYEYPTAGIRLKMLEESLIIYKKMTTEETPSFNGEFYKIDGAINQPKPIQKPYPPLWVCGGGEKVTLKLLAKYGDYGNWDVDVEGFIEKSKILQEHCDNVGRNFEEIGRTLHTNVLISENQKDLDKKIKKLSTYTNIPEDYYHERPLIGTKDKVFTTLNQYKEAGCEYLIAYIPDIVWGDTVDFLSELN
jgi:alkanesulfonate monooxygenase SsuD/methylene tetrahydromethanopterin reductase-like flavin-dependent oxidoreductase (luciferase family)